VIKHRVKSSWIRLGPLDRRELAIIQGETQITCTVFAREQQDDGTFVLMGTAILQHAPKDAFDTGIGMHDISVDQATVDKIEVAQPCSLFVGKVDWVIFQDSPLFESAYREIVQKRSQAQA
jgi:hypothetical protein